MLLLNDPLGNLLGAWSTALTMLAAERNGKPMW